MVQWWCELSPHIGVGLILLFLGPWWHWLVFATCSYSCCRCVTVLFDWYICTSGKKEVSLITLWQPNRFFFFFTSSDMWSPVCSVSGWMEGVGISYLLSLFFSGCLSSAQTGCHLPVRTSWWIKFTCRMLSVCMCQHIKIFLMKSQSFFVHFIYKKINLLLAFTRAPHCMCVVLTREQTLLRERVLEINILCKQSTHVAS